MTSKGIDTTDRTLTGKALVAAGYAFACRYVLNAPKGQDKELTAAEIREKSAAGCRIVSNFEWAPVPANTVAEGKAHANAFLDSPAGTMGPAWHPCYYSVDTAAKAGAFDNYAHGWADVLGPERCGVYGDGSLYRALKSAGLVTYAWQSMSSSFPGNSNTTGADIIQTGNGHVGGHSVDFNTAPAALYGGWLLGERDPSNPEVSDMELTDKLSNGKTVEQALVAASGLPGSVWHTNQFTPDAAGAYTESGSARMDRLDQLQAYVQSPKFVADIAAAAGQGADASAIAGATADLLAARLQS